MAAWIGPAGVGIIVYPVDNKLQDCSVSIIKSDLMTVIAGVVHSGNPIHISEHTIEVSECKITQGFDSTNLYSLAMGSFAP